MSRVFVATCLIETWQAASWVGDLPLGPQFPRPCNGRNGSHLTAALGWLSEGGRGCLSHDAESAVAVLWDGHVDTSRCGPRRRMRPVSQSWHLLEGGASRPILAWLWQAQGWLWVLREPPSSGRELRGAPVVYSQ